MKKHRGIIYGVLVALLLTMGVWWVYFLTTENSAHTRFERQKLANDRLHATFLLQADPTLLDDESNILAESFPDLVFTRTSDGIQVDVDPTVVRATEDRARSTFNMFLYEGLFFMLLLLAGSIILVVSWRSESRFVQARELFLAGATHEFKTPLASLRLYTETLGRSGLKETDKNRIQSRMVEDIQRLEYLVDEILALSADDTFSPGPKVVLDLVALSRKVMEDLRGYAADHEARLTLEAEENHFILGQEVAFNLTLRNLLINAIKHNEQPVSITVTLSRRRKRHQLSVHDDGQGIPKRLQEKVFECFYSESQQGRPASGAGVGLYLVQRNVTNMGGTIRLESSPGKGCTFLIQLPAHQGDSR